MVFGQTTNYLTADSEMEMKRNPNETDFVYESFKLQLSFRFSYIASVVVR